MILKTINPSVFTIERMLDEAECQQLVALAEQAGFQSASVRTPSGQLAMPRVRNNERSLVENAAWVALLWERLEKVALPEIDGVRAEGLPKDLRFYKYRPDQRFKMHKDGPWHEGGLSSKLTFLVYLNEDFTGGATDFRDFQITPVTGTALLFIHDTWHEGAVVQDGTKYVLRSDVLYASPA